MRLIKKLKSALKWLRTKTPSHPRMVENPNQVIGFIEHSYPLAEHGILLFGWHLFPTNKPFKISIRNTSGQSVSVKEHMFPLIREDVYEKFKQQFPLISSFCGYVCLAPMPTNPGESRALHYDFCANGSCTLKVPTEQSGLTGIPLIKEMLGHLPAFDRIQYQLYDLFSQGLGKAIEVTYQTTQRPDLDIQIKQFGQPLKHPEFSVIVPLYGRYDYIRHQLAQFTDDPDFKKVDLVYVVDDPKIIPQTLQLAAKYHSLFSIPFRVIYYGVNLGFAVANNIGVCNTNSDHLVLLNSDVIPQHFSWVSTLKDALDNLPDAGAVAPLLQFGDGSIQHAGMYPKTDQQLPGFLLNNHRKMGMAWNGDMSLPEHPMLTAACLMMRTEDYRDLGGFDEGYLIGDFEDSDLCLAIRNKSKRLWLVPQARLWHLERQSQNLDSIANQRQLLTLYNGWRYHQKILAGKIADPSLFEGAS